MTTFDTTFAEQAFPLLIAEFGELIVYYPNDGDLARQISAIVEREPQQPMPGIQNAPVQSIRCRVYDDPITGVSGGTIDDSVAEVELAPLRGGPEKRMRVEKELDASGHTYFRCV